MIYADAEYYKTEYKGKLSIEDADLKKASHDIDALTYNRAVNFDSLTYFQQETIKECTCMQAEFRSENADLIESVVSSYSLNGASIAFDGVAAKMVNNTCVRNDIYAYLKQTGLCCGVLK